MLTRSLVVCCSQWSTQRFLMIFVSLRSPNHVLTLRLLLAFASPPNSFVKFKGGNLSDGRRLDWCVCRKSVNNINFIWINTGNWKWQFSHGFLSFFFFGYTSWDKSKISIKVWSDDSKSSDRENSSKYILWKIYWIICHSLVPEKPYSGYVQDCKVLIGELACQLCSKDLCTVHFYKINTGASWSLWLQGKTDAISKARYSLKAPWDHTLSLTSKKCPHGYS